MREWGEEEESSTSNQRERGRRHDGERRKEKAIKEKVDYHFKTKRWCCTYLFHLLSADFCFTVKCFTEDHCDKSQLCLSFSAQFSVPSFLPLVLLILNIFSLPLSHVPLITPACILFLLPDSYPSALSAAVFPSLYHALLSI